ncbi:hypothetical protein vseg_015288 [Gypsophila vaccaria]
MEAYIAQEMEYLSSNYNFMEELGNEMIISMNMFSNNAGFMEGLNREALFTSMNSYIQQQLEFMSENDKYMKQLECELIGMYLPTKTHVHKDEDADVCSICLDELEEGSCVGVLDCTHEFHANCVKNWLAINNVCPLCKSTGVRFG